MTIEHQPILFVNLHASLLLVILEVAIDILSRWGYLGAIRFQRASFWLNLSNRVIMSPVQALATLGHASIATLEWLQIDTLRVLLILLQLWVHFHFLGLWSLITHGPFLVVIDFL